MVILCREHIKTEVLLLIYLIMLSYLRLGGTSGGHLSCIEEGNSWIRLLSVYSSWVVDITKDKNSPPTWPISGVSPPVWWGGKKTTLQISNQNFLCSNSHPVPLVLSMFFPEKSWLHFLYIFPIGSWRWQLNFLLPFSGWKKKKKKSSKLLFHIPYAPGPLTIWTESSIPVSCPEAENMTVVLQMSSHKCQRGKFLPLHSCWLHPVGDCPPLLQGHIAVQVVH